jgi:hypothetical protein
MWYYFLEAVNEVGLTFPGWAEKLTLLGVLTMLVYYFSKKVDKLEIKRDSERKEFEAKYEKLYEKFIEVETNNNEVLNNLNHSINQLTIKIENLR